MKRTLLFAAAAAFSVNMMAESQVLYSQDYEKLPIGLFSSSVKNRAGVSPYYWSVDANGVSQISVANDADHGNYLEIKQRTSDWSAGGAYSFFYTDDAKSAGEDGDFFKMEEKGITQYTVEFDAALYTSLNAYNKGGNMTWAGASMEFALLNPSFAAWKRCDYGLMNGGEAYEYDNVIYIKQLAVDIKTDMPGEDTYKIDEVVPFNLQTDLNETKVNIPTDGSWNHWKVSVNRAAPYDISLTVGDKEVAKFNGDPEMASQILRGIYFRTGNGKADDPSYVRIDNLKVTGEASTTGINEVNAQEADAAEKTVVKYVKDGVLYISTPNGTVTAAGVAVK